MIVGFVGYSSESMYGGYSKLALVFTVRNIYAIFFLIEVPSIRLMVETARLITRPIFSKFLFIYLIYYFFAMTGILCFGG